MRMYGELAGWFHLLSPPEEYTEEAADYEELLLAAFPAAQTLLELGSGAATRSRTSSDGSTAR